MIIVFGSMKGGSGKTTIATNVAACLAGLGKSVVLVDCDSQGSAYHWAQERLETKAPLITCVNARDNVSQILKELGGKYDFVIADTKGADGKELRTAFATADKFIMPLRPSQHDLNTLESMETIHDTMIDFNPDLKISVLLNLCPTNPSIKEREEMVNSVSDYEKFPLLKTFISDRKSFRDTATEGLGVSESNNPKAKDEIERLTKEILEL